VRFFFRESVLHRLVVRGQRVADVEQPDHATQPLASQGVLHQSSETRLAALCPRAHIHTREVEKVVSVVDQEDVQRAVFPGVPEIFAIRRPTSALSNDDLPTFDRPTNATSGRGGSSSTSARGNER